MDQTSGVLRAAAKLARLRLLCVLVVCILAIFAGAWALSSYGVLRTSVRAERLYQVWLCHGNLGVRYGVPDILDSRPNFKPVLPTDYSFLEWRWGTNVRQLAPAGPEWLPWTMSRPGSGRTMVVVPLRLGGAQQ